MHRAPFSALLAAALLAVCTAADAQNAFTARPANVRAGPDRSYPLVTQLGPGTPVQVMGCLSDWSWCDVVFDGARGWVYAPSLAYEYEGGRVPLYAYAPSLGLPIITFSLGSYWDRYYRGRPWYSERGEWERRHVPHMRPPGPPPYAGPPPAGPPPRRPGRYSIPYRGGAAPEHVRPERNPQEGRLREGRPQEGRRPEGRRPEGRRPEGRPQEGRAAPGRAPPRERAREVEPRRGAPDRGARSPDHGREGERPRSD